MSFLEILGYVSSFLVAISLTMSSILRLRWMNLIGALTFATYGLLIKAYPVFAVNGFIVLANIYYLFKIYTAKESFRFVEIQKDSKYLEYFFDFCKKDILYFFPDFSFEPKENTKAFYLVRNLIPCGVLIGESNGEYFDISIDYVIPEYRDLKVGEHIYKRSLYYFKRQNYKYFRTEPITKAHTKYLQRMGFKKENDKYIKEII